MSEQLKDAEALRRGQTWDQLLHDRIRPEDWVESAAQDPPPSSPPPAGDPDTWMLRWPVM